MWKSYEEYNTCVYGLGFFLRSVSNDFLQSVQALGVVLCIFSTVRPKASGTFQYIFSGFSPRLLHQLWVVWGEKKKKGATRALDFKEVHIQLIVLLVEA